ncbi:DNA primase family protein [Microbacterium maritypicum]|uniref:Phage/plasmid primase, P4 family n=1 Tax=Microbacterium maritypicum TaxID=33918 RepID=A0ACD4B823_MICMQ|nr:phage/plasmid primase, P4 family [Microbacterium liquefaciens]UTT53751.1 phage/plasmid primase, P4 family [Microbacterium liquefaciens]
MSKNLRTIKLTGARAVATPPPAPPKLAPLTTRDREYITSRAVSLEFAKAEGWHRAGSRIGIPVHDVEGDVVNVRLHLPGATERKTINTKGQGSPTRLVGIHRLRDDDAWVVITGGEFDYAAAASAGLSAVFGSNGEASVPKVGLDALAGRRVALALDADTAGKKDAELWAAKLDPLVRELRRVALPEGTDVNDWFTAGHTADELLELVDSSPVHGQSARRDSAELLTMALAKAADGESRDDTGLWLACQLRDERYTRTEAWTIVQAYQQAVEHDKEPPYSESDAKVNLEQAWNREPRKPSGKASGKDRFPLTELGNAERFVAKFGDYCKYIAALNEWWVWDGRRWASDTTGQVDRWARQTVRAIPDEAADIEDDKLRNKFLTWARMSESRSKLENLIRLSQSEPGVTASPADFDRDHDVLNVANGVVNLRSGEFREHRIEDMLHRMSPVEYDPDAACPGFNKFLARVQPDPEMRSFLQRAAGYSATGHTTEHRFLMPYSDGRSGKSTFGGLLFAVFGMGEYAVHLRPEALAMSRFEQIPADVARLVGARYVLTGELEEGMHLNESLMKSLTGGDDPITARLLHKNPITFFPQCTIWMPTNHRPVVRGTDEGIWGRHLLVSDWVFIPESERDKELSARIKATELPGLLNWIIAGAVEWYRQGLNPPESVVAATKAYREESDLMGAFLDEVCEVSPDEQCSKSEMYAAYTDWCREGGLKPVTKIAFGRMLKKHPGSDITETRVGKAKVHTWAGVSVAVSERHYKLGRITPISAAQNAGAK